MNKYILLGIAAVFLLAGGVVYRVFLIPESSVPVTTGNVKNITIRAVKNEWRFTPEDVDIQRGDKVVMEVINEDDYDHGLAIDAYGISQRMPAHETIRIEFIATQEGDFQFYCSVPCGEGEVGDKHRTHFDMIGTLHVKSLTPP